MSLRLLTLTSLLATLGVHAQGTIWFSNRYVPLGLDVYFLQSECGTLRGSKLGNTWSVGLYWGTRRDWYDLKPAVLLKNGVPTTVSFITSVTSGPTGYFSGGELACVEFGP